MTAPGNGCPVAHPWPGHPPPQPGPDERPGQPDGAAMAARRLRTRLRQALAADLPPHVRELQSSEPVLPVRARREIAHRILTEALDAHNAHELAANRPLLGAEQERSAITAVLDELFGLAGLQPLLDDPSIETINANRFDQVFVQHTDGRRSQVGPIAGSNEELTDLVRSWAARASSQERRFDHGCPSLNLQLPGGARLFAVLGLTAGGVTAVSVRRHAFRTVTLAQLRRRGTLDPGVERFLRALVRARKNILITGGAGAGKTTLLRALAAEMDPHERIVTIEDTFELGLELDPAVHADVTALQARDPNTDNVGGISQAELVRWALRMSPDRVIVGEIRGPEVVPVCNAMSQGNDGSLATLHASSSQVAFTRLAAYAAQGPERLPLEATNLLVASAVHFVVHLARSRADRAVRVVSSIREVTGADGPCVISNEVYRPGDDHRARPVAGALRTDTLDDLVEVGFDPDLLAAPEGWWPP